MKKIKNDYISKEEKLVSIENNLNNFIRENSSVNITEDTRTISNKVKLLSENLVENNNFYNYVTKNSDEKKVEFSSIQYTEDSFNESGSVIIDKDLNLNEALFNEFESSEKKMTAELLQAKDKFIHDNYDDSMRLGGYDVSESIMTHKNSVVLNMIDRCHEFISTGKMFNLDCLEENLIKLVLKSLNHKIISPILNYLIVNDYSLSSCLTTALILSPIIISIGGVFRYYWFPTENVSRLFKKVFSYLNFPGIKFKINNLNLPLNVNINFKEHFKELNDCLENSYKKQMLYKFAAFGIFAASTGLGIYGYYKLGGGINIDIDALVDHVLKYGLEKVKKYFSDIAPTAVFSLLSWFFPKVTPARITTCEQTATESSDNLVDRQEIRNLSDD